MPAARAMPDNRTVLVLGGGVVGVTCAYVLARAGHRVTLVERRASVGLETSFANGGLITPSMSDPWAAPGLPWKILQWMGREDSPFLVRPQALPGLLAWGLAFLGNCRSGPWRRNTATILRLAQYSRKVLHELVAETGVTYDGERLGTLKLFRDPLSMESAKRGAGLLRRLGVEHRILSPQDCVIVEPALAGREALFSGGIYFADDESGDAFTFTNAVAEAARRQGVEFLCSTNVKAIRRSGNRVTAVETDRGELTADAYVLALGWSAPVLARPLGLRLPIYPVKGYSITFSTEGWNGAPRIPLVDDGRKMAFTPLGRRLRVVGTAEFTGPDTRLTPGRLDSMVERLLEFFPELPNRDGGEPWTGLRPMTPDGIPILGRSPLENLYLNLGHGHLGWTMACGTAKAVADMVSGTAPEVDLAGMTYGRR